MKLNGIVEHSLELDACRVIGTQILRLNGGVQHLQRAVDVGRAVDHAQAHGAEEEKGRYDELQHDAAPERLLAHNGQEADWCAPIVESAAYTEGQKDIAKAAERGTDRMCSCGKITTTTMFIRACSPNDNSTARETAARTHFPCDRRNSS